MMELLLVRQLDRTCSIQELSVLVALELISNIGATNRPVTDASRALACLRGIGSVREHLVVKEGQIIRVYTLEAVVRRGRIRLVLIDYGICSLVTCQELIGLLVTSGV